jgi:hypothetical protein
MPRCRCPPRPRFRLRWIASAERLRDLALAAANHAARFERRDLRFVILGQLVASADRLDARDYLIAIAHEQRLAAPHEAQGMRQPVLELGDVDGLHS